MGRVSQAGVEAVAVQVVLGGGRPRGAAAAPGQRLGGHAAAAAARVHVDGAAVDVDAGDGAAVDCHAAGGARL